MANFNKVILIGRLTRDPEERTRPTSAVRIVSFGFAVSNNRKNKQTGQWEDDPMFIDVDVFGRPDSSRLVDQVMQSLRKGSQICLEGKLVLDRWEQDGQKRSKHKIIADSVQFLDPRPLDGEAGNRSRGFASANANASVSSQSRDADADFTDDPGSRGDEPHGSDDEIPF